MGIYNARILDIITSDKIFIAGDGPVQYEIYWWTIERNTSMRKKRKSAVPASAELFNVRVALLIDKGEYKV